MFIATVPRQKLPGARRTALLVALTAAIGLGIRLGRSRHRRSLHPDGRSFTGNLEVKGLDPPVGAEFIDQPGRYGVLIRLSKGIGTRRGRPDIRGVAIRVYADRELDLLLSTAGSGRITRHLPAPRRSFDVPFGSITSYRTKSRQKVYLSARPDPDTSSLGASLESIVAAVQGRGSALLLSVDDYRGPSRVFGRVTLESLLSSAEDARLAFDPVRRSSAGLHPTGTVHSIRALAYRLSQRWRGATPVPPDAAAVARTAAHQ
jgi:hypothetical protein